MHFWPKFGNTNFNLWWLIPRTSSKWGKFWLLGSIWPWSSRSIIPKNNRDLNQGLLHLCSKFGDSSLNGWWVTARTSWWLTDRHTHTHTHAGNDNTRRPKLASGKNGMIAQVWLFTQHCMLTRTKCCPGKNKPLLNTTDYYYTRGCLSQVICIHEFELTNGALQSHYATVNFLWSAHNRNPLAHSGSHMSSYHEHEALVAIVGTSSCCLICNTLRLSLNSRHLADVIFKCIFLNEDIWIFIKISLKFVRKGTIDNIPTLVQIMAIPKLQWPNHCSLGMNK